MLRQRLIGRHSAETTYSTPKSHKKEQPILSESKIGLIGLVVSLSIIFAKSYYDNRESIRHFILEKHLVTREIIVTDGDILYAYVWENAVKYSNIWLPALCGILTTYFTWVMVYLDSNVPGVQPPSPFSPSKYKERSGHYFHLNYVFAVLIGFLVFCYTYWKGLSINF